MPKHGRDKTNKPMIARCYLEITNVCNLDCRFCPKTERPKRRLTVEEFDRLTDRLRGQVRFLYLHLMGEPLLHPQLPQLIVRARQKGLVPIITTNGTLLPQVPELVEAAPHKVQISLHSHEGNGRTQLEAYLHGVMTFAVQAAAQGILVILRLWNRGGYERENERILSLIEPYCPRPWTQRPDGWKLSTNLYIEFDRMFEWPDSGREELGEDLFCYALRNQIGVLVDGSVVPCCLDHAGDIVLGNLFEQTLPSILTSPRARSIYDGFTRHEAVEPLCRRCGYAAKTKQYRK